MGKIRPIRPIRLTVIGSPSDWSLDIAGEKKISPPGMPAG